MYIYTHANALRLRAPRVGASTGAVWALSHLLEDLRRLLLVLPLRQRRLRRDVGGNDLFDTIAVALTVESGG